MGERNQYFSNSSSCSPQPCERDETEWPLKRTAENCPVITHKRASSPCGGGMFYRDGAARRRCGTPAAGQVASWPAGNPVNTVQWPVYFRKRVLLRKEQMTGEWTGCQKGRGVFTILWSPLLLLLIVSVCCFLLKCWPHAEEDGMRTKCREDKEHNYGRN